MGTQTRPKPHWDRPWCVTIDRYDSRRPWYALVACTSAAHTAPTDTPHTRETHPKNGFGRYRAPRGSRMTTVTSLGPLDSAQCACGAHTAPFWEGRCGVSSPKERRVTIVSWCGRLPHRWGYSRQASGPHRTTAARQSSHDSKTCLGTDLPVTVASQDHPESKESTPTLLEGHPLS